MSDQSLPLHVSLQEDEVHSDSLRFKVALGERSMNRLKQQNTRHKQKIAQLEQQIVLLSKDKMTLLDKIAKLENGCSRLQSQKKSLERAIELRTKRHQSQQSHYLSLGQKQLMQRKVKRAQEQVLQAKQQVQKLMKQCHTLLNEIQSQRGAKELLQNELTVLSKKLHHNTIQKNELQHLYSKKQQILEFENRELKDKVQDLILQLKLQQQTKQIQGLLKYEDHIGVQQYNYKQSIYNNKSTLPTMQSKLDLPFGQTFRENICRCQQLAEELVQYEEMVELLKQKNERLVSQMQASKKRCQNLQSIICGETNKPLRK